MKDRSNAGRDGMEATEIRLGTEERQISEAEIEEIIGALGVAHDLTIKAKIDTEIEQTIVTSDEAEENTVEIAEMTSVEELVAIIVAMEETLVTQKHNNNLDTIAGRAVEVVLLEEAMIDEAEIAKTTSRVLHEAETSHVVPTEPPTEKIRALGLPIRMLLPPSQQTTLLLDNLTPSLLQLKPNLPLPQVIPSKLP